MTDTNPSLPAPQDRAEPTPQEWQSIDTAPENVAVLTKIDDAKGERNEAPLIRRGRLWYFTDDSMYVYYTPTHWRPL